MREADKERAKINAIIGDLYIEYLNGNITEKVYKDLLKKYKKKLAEINETQTEKAPQTRSMFSGFFVFSMAIRSLKRRKVRTALTVLGIVVGVTAIVALASVSEGMRQQMTGWIETSMGADLVVTGAGSSDFMPQNKIAEEYANEIAQMSGVKSVSNLLFETGLINGQSGLIQGTDSKAGLNQITIVSGSSFNENSEYETIIGLKLKNRLGVGLGDYVTLASLSLSKKFRVIGVFQTLSLLMDDACLVPLRAAQEIFGDEGKVSTILVNVSDIEKVGLVRSKIEDTFNGIQVIEQKKVLETIQQGTNILKMFLLAVASISMLVAGIGIMNTMFMSVIERKREIGILKAIGASKLKIMRIFLTEAVLLGIMGGALGCFSGVSISKIAESLTTEYFSIPIIVQTPPEILGFGFLFGLISAVSSSLYPCWKASSLRPVEALRYE